MGKVESKFLKAAIFVSAGLYLLFILFTIIFSGRWHALRPEGGFSLAWLGGRAFVGGLAAPLALVIVAFLVYVLVVPSRKEDSE